MAREPIPTWFFAVVIVRRGNEYLLVQERKHGQGWYFPAGRVEPGETLAAAAVRETQEEAGIAVALDGILRIEHSPSPDYARIRVLFTARPIDDTPPKHEPDEHSLGAAWFPFEKLEHLSLRGPEVIRVLAAVERGAPAYPLSLLTPEGLA